MVECVAPQRAPPVAANGNGKHGDTMLSAEQAAERLGVKPSWLYRLAGGLPFAKRVGTRALRFSERGIADYLTRGRT